MEEGQHSAGDETSVSTPAGPEISGDSIWSAESVGGRLGRMGVTVNGEGLVRVLRILMRR